MVKDETQCLPPGYHQAPEKDTTKLIPPCGQEMGSEFRGGRTVWSNPGSLPGQEEGARHSDE